MLNGQVNGAAGDEGDELTRRFRKETIEALAELTRAVYQLREQNARWEERQGDMKRRVSDVEDWQERHDEREIGELHEDVREARRNAAAPLAAVDAPAAAGRQALSVSGYATVAAATVVKTFTSYWRTMTFVAMGIATVVSWLAPHISWHW